ncbi:MAG: glycoside hydrolase family 2 protein [Anaerolineae bacterium]|nr:glycoside hydrolase family 2 protein [Anaerolineae bacterium]
MEKLSLNGQWSLWRIDQPDDVIAAQVPGCVHTDLLDAGRIPDPYFRDNETRLQWISAVDWLYERRFEVTPDLLRHERVLLRCHGLDTIAALSLNGVEIARTDNMYRTWEFDVKAHLRAGENTIRVHFSAPVPYVEQMDAERGAMPGWVQPMRINSGGWIRKEPCNFGWDWGPVLVTSGIWRDIEIIAFDAARLCDVRVEQFHSDSGRVTLTVSGGVEAFQPAALHAEVRVSLGGQPVAEAAAPVGEGRFSADLTIASPRLWWTNGLGDQPLYDVAVTLSDGAPIDVWAGRVGLRLLKLERHLDEWGESFSFSINGAPFFAKGANWIPADPFAARVSPALYRRLLDDARRANMNMLRVWGGGIYESDLFYDLCDEYGIAVWQDFMFACGVYPSYDAAFMANVRSEAEDNVRRLRHHACLALWCGNNEIEQGMGGSGWKETISWEVYGALFDKLLPEVVAALDPHRPYWPSSAHSPHGDREDHMNPKWGDSHLWSVWHGRQPFEWYHTRTDRFVSEFGFQSFPPPKTIDSFTLPEDRNITSYVMEHHQRSAIGNSAIVDYLLSWFRLPSSFESLVWLSQILQGLAMQYAVEGWRRNMPQSMGALYWQLNDCWPGPTWSGIDYRGNWKALHSMARRFFAPLLISGVEDASAGSFDIHITSDHLSPVDGVARWRILTPAGDLLGTGVQPVTIKPLSSEKVASVDVADLLREHTPRGVLVLLELGVGGETVSENLVLFSRPKHIALVKPTLTPTFYAADGGLKVALQTDQPALFVWLEMDGVDARFSDNFFHLMPGQTKIITLEGAADQAAALRLRSLADTY